MPITQYIPTIHRLNKLALKKVFESLSYDEEKELEEGIGQQSRKIGLTMIEKKELGYIITALEKNEREQFNKVKEGIKKHGLDYKALYRAGL